MFCATGRMNFSWIYPETRWGNRYYTDENIKEFLKIKELKEKGYQLKAIRMYLKNEKQREQRNKEKERDRQILTITNARELGLESDGKEKQPSEVATVEDPKIQNGAVPEDHDGDRRQCA